MWRFLFGETSPSEVIGNNLTAGAEETMIKTLPPCVMTPSIQPDGLLSSIVILLTCPSIATPTSKIPLLFPAILPVPDESSLPGMHAALCVQNVSRQTQR